MAKPFLLSSMEAKSATLSHLKAEVKFCMQIKKANHVLMCYTSTSKTTSVVYIATFSTLMFVYILPVLHCLRGVACDVLLIASTQLVL